MGTMKHYKLKSHFFVIEFVSTIMFRLGGIFLFNVYTFMLKIFVFISNYLCRSKNEENGSNIPAKHSPNDNGVVSEMSNDVELQRRKDSCEDIAETEDSVFLQSGWISNTSKYELVSGYIEEPKKVKFMVQEIFLGSDENLFNTNLDCEIHPKDSLDENLKISVEGIDFSNEVGSRKSAFLEGNNETKIEDKEDGDIDHMRVMIKYSVLEHSNDEYIQLEPSSVNPADISKKETIINSWDFASDEENESDVLREHQNLVQQLKMELKNSRIRGLPTISEDFETPKMLEDLKPLKIDHKFEYKDVMKEIQKFYKIYTEKMRKLDVLNYQTLNAISFLQMDSKVFSTCKKISASTRLNLSKIWPRKVRKIYADAMEKPITDMHRDLELVYVGQLCLSWEILFWLYVKAQEIMGCDSKEHSSYNRAAEEFQKFQVLMQRFMEDEQFQGPRILNYVKNRCMVRGLLKVPMIKDDSLKDNKDRRGEKDAISVKLLVQIIRESMLIFWEFLGAEKGVQGTKVDLQKTDKLVVDIITNLHKIDRRIREQVRTQNCIVKKLQKHDNHIPDHELVASQVVLRLVSRVLNLSRLTRDQLIWCQEKLSTISFVGRRVHVEPSFLLFPC